MLWDCRQYQDFEQHSWTTKFQEFASTPKHKKRLKWDYPIRSPSPVVTRQPNFAWPNPVRLIILRCPSHSLRPSNALCGDSCFVPTAQETPFFPVHPSSEMADATALQMPSPETKRKKKRQKTEKKKKLPHIHVLLLRPTQFNVGYAQVFIRFRSHCKYFCSLVFDVDCNR